MQVRYKALIQDTNTSMKIEIDLIIISSMTKKLGTKILSSEPRNQYQHIALYIWNKFISNFSMTFFFIMQIMMFCDLSFKYKTTTLILYRLLISTFTVFLNWPDGSSPCYYNRNIESHSEYLVYYKIDFKLFSKNNDILFFSTFLSLKIWDKN